MHQQDDLAAISAKTISWHFFDFPPKCVILHHQSQIIMSLPNVFAATCVAFILFHITVHILHKVYVQKPKADAQKPAKDTVFSFPSEVSTKIMVKLIDKKYNLLIVEVLESAELGAIYSVSATQRRLNISYRHAVQITEQMETLKFITPFDENSAERRWRVSRNNVDQIIQLIDNAQPHQQ